jgi:phosphopantothenate---cysteine ligase (CTP)
MKCIVTAGPTYETLDNVRRLTNFSTGRLGWQLARALEGQGHDVRLLLGVQATWHDDQPPGRIVPFTTTADLLEQFRQLAAEGTGAIFHAAAVSDFKFGQVWHRSASGELTEARSGKISTREGTLLAELVPTPKVLPQLRGLFPQARIVGWKYEVEGDQPRVLQAAQRQLVECCSDACVANGPAYGPGFGLVTSAPTLAPAHRRLADAKELFAALGEMIG